MLSCVYRCCFGLHWFAGTVQGSSVEEVVYCNSLSVVLVCSLLFRASLYSINYHGVETLNKI